MSAATMAPARESGAPSSRPSWAVVVPLHERVSLQRLLWVGPLAVGAAVAANVAIRAAALSLFAIPPEFRPLQGPIQTIAFTAVGVAGAAAVFGLLARSARRPVRAFQATSLVVLLLSFIPDLLLLASAAASGGSIEAVAALMVMHVVAAAIAVGLLTALAVEEVGVVRRPLTRVGRGL